MKASIWVGSLLAVAVAHDQAGAQECGAKGVIERSALLSIYEGMNSQGWERTDNWGSDAPVSTWYGVTVNEDGCVTHLELHRNWLDGAMPAAIADLTQLRVLDLSSNFITELPPSIGTLEHLRTLNLNRNSGLALPDEMRDLTELRVLDLGAMHLFGFPSFLKHLRKLDVLVLHRNNIGALAPEFFENVTGLRELHVGRTEIAELPPQIALLTNLRVLDISDFGGDDIPGTVFSFGKLEELYMARVNDDALPEALFEMETLRVLEIGGMPLSQWYPELFQLPNLRVLRARSLPLDTEISLGPELAGATLLEELQLRDSNVENVSAEIGTLIHLEVIDLAGTGITSLPSSFSNLTSLREIDLQLNGLTEVPDLSGMTSLEVLSINNNHISDLNDELASLPSLTRLSVYGNRLDTCQLKEPLSYASELELFEYYESQEDFLVPVTVMGAQASVSACGSSVKWYEVSAPATTLGTGETFNAPAPGTYQAVIDDDLLPSLQLWTEPVSL